MSELEHRLRQAGQPAAAPGLGPDLGAITRRGRSRRRNKRAAAGGAVAALLAVAAVGVGTTLSESTSSIEAAEGGQAAPASTVPPPTTAAVDGATAQGAQDGVGASGGQAFSTTTAPPTTVAGAVEAATLGELLGEPGSFCLSYDSETTGAGFVSFAFDTDSGMILVGETRIRGGVADPANVFSFDGIASDTGRVVVANGTFIGEGDIGPSEQQITITLDADLSRAASSTGFTYDTRGCSALEEEATPGATGTIADGLGGSLFFANRQLIHLRADQREVTIDLPVPEADIVQHWVTDIAPIDGVPHLFIDRFVNRLPPNGQAGDDFEVTILAVNLETDELIVVESRRITNVSSPEWIYNGHITTDGTNIIVMRELWQSFCLYAEGITIDGDPVAVPADQTYPKPEGLDQLTGQEIEGIMSGNGSISPCIGLGQIGDGGVAALGRWADADDFADFTSAFNEAYGYFGN